MAANLDANIWGVCGASGTGKGLWIKTQLTALRPRRLVVWDFMKEYREFAGQPLDSLRAVHAAMVKAGAEGAARIAYCPVGSGQKAVRKEFEGLCELVYAWENCTFIAEELSNVTTPGWAPPAWQKMTTSGRHCNVHIIGTTQTPALVDKTFFGNCTRIHCGPLREYEHRNSMAKRMEIDIGRLGALVKFQWLEKDFDTGQVSDGWTYPPGFKGKTTRRTPPAGTGIPA